MYTEEQETIIAKAADIKWRLILQTITFLAGLYLGHVYSSGLIKTLYYSAGAVLIVGLLARCYGFCKWKLGSKLYDGDGACYVQPRPGRGIVATIAVAVVIFQIITKSSAMVIYIIFAALFIGAIISLAVDCRLMVKVRKIRAMSAEELIGNNYAQCTTADELRACRAMLHKRVSDSPDRAELDKKIDHHYDLKMAEMK